MDQSVKNKTGTMAAIRCEDWKSR